MPRRFLNTGVNLVGGTAVAGLTMGLKWCFDHLIAVNTGFLLSTLSVATAALFFGRKGGAAAILANIVVQTNFLFYSPFYTTHVNSSTDKSIVLVTFCLTAILVTLVIDRAMSLHRKSIALINSLRNERAQSIEYRTLLEGAVDAVAEPLAIFEPVNDERGQPVDLVLKFSNSTRPYNVVETLSLRRQLVGRQLSALLPEMCRADLLEKLLDVLRTGVPLNTEAKFPDDQYGTATYDVAAKRVGETIVVQWRTQRRFAVSA